MTTRTTTDPVPPQHKWRLTSARGLWTLLAVQSLCALFFIYDATMDAMGIELALTQVLEYAAAAALFVGVALTVAQLRVVLNRQSRLEDQLAAASGAFHDVLVAYFDDWKLTPAERDVALLVVKGMSLKEIADMRGSAIGTVKAHSANVYRKADVSGRAELVSHMIEDLASAPLVA